MTRVNLLTAHVNALSSSIAETADRLRALTQRSHQADWHFSPQAHVPEAILQSQMGHDWAIAPLNARHHIAWAKGKQPLWLWQTITVPENLNGFPVTGMALRLGLTWWAETARVYVNGVLVQEGDLFDCFPRILLSDRVAPGDTFAVAVHLLSPEHDNGALVRSEVFYETANVDLPEPGFVADELTVLKIYAATLAPERLADIAAAIAPLDWSAISQQDTFLAELAALRQRLQPFSAWIKQRQIACVGHAHLDLAWLWPVADTWTAAERTFRSVLSLQADFPELTYTHSSPALFDWLETHQPELFRQVVEAVQCGAWAIDAGLWVEPELNTIGGESLARQILYGQQYSRSRFGQVSAIAWLPDCFGFSWQLPQLLRQGGIECFATQKLRWNDTTKFPHGLFQWEGLDGTAILSLTLPLIGSDIDPVKMATDGATWEAKTGLTEALWLPGVGDHGGGPTRDMLEKARRWARSPFFPELQFTSVYQHLQHLTHPRADEARQRTFAGDAETSTPPCLAPPDANLPVWRDELYLELHRGCYTVHADQKWFNRRCEETLREAELFSVLAHGLGTLAYPKATLEATWKQVLFNQFHDILPGTSIPEVFATVNPAWQLAYDTAKEMRVEALAAIARHITLPTPPAAQAIPVVVFNSLNWEQTDMVELPLSALPRTATTWQVFDPILGDWVTSQLSRFTDQHETPPGSANLPAATSPRLLFLAQVPAVGYRVFWLVPAGLGAVTGHDLTTDNAKFKVQNSQSSLWQLENDFVRAVIDPQTGDLVELWEKETERNVVRSPANQLQAFRDAGQYWDAWNIAPDYEDHPLYPPQLQSIEWLERGPLRQRLRVSHRLENSTIQQDYVLDVHLPYLKVATEVDWRATQIILKAAFPLTFETDQATFEIPFGAIARSTHAIDLQQKAKWEVPALRWADMNNSRVGLSILTDYKHGFDTKPDQLRLTLLKAPLWPDPHADRGYHRFTYGLYPHAGEWQTAKTPQWAIAFGTGMSVTVGAPQAGAEPVETAAASPRFTSLRQSLLDLGSDRLHVAALKQAESQSDQYVLRCWDMYGKETTLQVSTFWGTPPYQRVNLLEEALTLEDPAQIAPWQIATLRFSAFVNNSLSS